jgi:hypothetical protein
MCNEPTLSIHAANWCPYGPHRAYFKSIHKVYYMCCHFSHFLIFQSRISFYLFSPSNTLMNRYMFSLALAMPEPPRLRNEDNISKEQV